MNENMKKKGGVVGWSEEWKVDNPVGANGVAVVMMKMGSNNSREWE